MAKTRILVGDDEASIRFAIRDFLSSLGYEVVEADTCRAVEDAFHASLPDALILDYLLPDGNAVDLLPRLKEIGPEVPVVILTGHGTIDLAVRAMKEGADQFITKPIELAALRVIVERLIDNHRTRRRQAAGSVKQARTAVNPFFGTSPAIRELADRARKVLVSDSPVLVQGETGSGKGILAQWLHDKGPRAAEPFVDLNCAALSRELVESEIFGHEKGAFTGAVASKAGLLEVAHRGTLFLDEIGDLDPAAQAKLLKVLEEGRFRRVGGVTDRRSDVRLISATHQDLARLMQEGSFRSDLYFRISTIPLAVPSLRDRSVDIPALARLLFRTVKADLGRSRLELSDEVVAALSAYPWPGNIRELRNVLERAALLGGGDVLEVNDLHFNAVSLRSSSPPTDTTLTLAEFERQHIQRVLDEENGQVARAAVRLGIPKSTLYEKIKKHGLRR